jgi:Holliday junction resolvase
MTHTRRQSRGYSHEHKVVLDVNKLDGWQCRRLGGSSANLPDIVATNNKESRIIIAEFKSLTPKALKRSKNLASSALYIPQDQAARCVEMVKMFDIYTTKEIVFAFKFSNVQTHKPVHYYFVVPEAYWFTLLYETAVIRCTSSGMCTIRYPTENGIATLTLGSRQYFL